MLIYCPTFTSQHTNDQASTPQVEQHFAKQQVSGDPDTTGKNHKMNADFGHRSNELNLFAYSQI